MSSWRIYSDNRPTEEERIWYICGKYGITNYTINEDLSIDVNGNVDLNDKRLNKLPLKFRNVEGYFHCHNNQLISLEGCPETVIGRFRCNNNNLLTLDECPRNIGGDFFFHSNNLPKFIYNLTKQEVLNYLKSLDRDKKLEEILK